MSKARAISIQFNKDWDELIEFNSQAHKNKFIEKAFEKIDEDLSETPALIAIDGCYPVIEAFEAKNGIFLIYKTSGESSVAINKMKELKHKQSSAPQPAKRDDEKNVEYLRELSGKIIRLDDPAEAKKRRERLIQIIAAASAGEERRKADAQRKESDAKNTEEYKRYYAPPRPADTWRAATYRVLSLNPSVPILFPAKIEKPKLDATNSSRPQAPEVTITFDLG